MDTDFLQRPTHDTADYTARIQRMYPDVYRRLLPAVNRVVQQSGSSRDLTEEQIDQLTREVVYRSGISASMPYGHNESTIYDIAKVLLLTAVYHTYRMDPPYTPYPTHPHYPPYPPYLWPYLYDYSPVAPYLLPFLGGFGHHGFHRR